MWKPATKAALIAAALLIAVSGCADSPSKGGELYSTPGVPPQGTVSGTGQSTGQGGPTAGSPAGSPPAMSGTSNGAGAGGSSGGAASPGDGVSSTGAPSTGNSTDTAESGSACSVHLFDSDDFDESDTNFLLTEPGKYETLKDLPGATQDWTDEADSIKVGSAAHVTIWSEPDFGGTSQQLEPGSAHSDIDEPSSLQLSC